MALGFGFNKAKVLASAEKFVQQGKLQNAIAEYEKIVKEDLKDLTALNTLGDLCARVGQNEQAAHYFKRVGDQYAQDGFTVKAIAIYKKLTKLSPSNFDHLKKLAELYNQQGLFNDARALYMQVADHLIRSGEHSQAARVFQRILELEPENAAIQAKLVDLYLKLGKKEEAQKIYVTAAEALYARGSYEAAEKALQRVLTMNPHNSAAQLLRGKIAADSGDAASAVQRLENVSDLESRPEGLRALLQAKLESGDPEGIEDLANKLATVHKDIGGVSAVAQWYVANRRIGNAVKLYELHAERFLAANRAGFKEALYALTGRIKESPESLNSLLRLLQMLGDASQGVEIMELQAHAYAQKGDFKQARDLYEKLAEMEPDNALHRQNYKQMLSKLGEDPATRALSAEEASQALMMEELEEGAHAIHQTYDPSTEKAIEAALTDAELFVSYNVPAKAIPPLEAVLPLAPRDVTVNQRLATLYARGGRYGDAARVCQLLSDLYREAGHHAEAARYMEAARSYAARSPGTTIPSNTTPRAGKMPPPVAEIEVPLEPAASSVQDFSFDVPDHLYAEAEASPAAGSSPAYPMEMAVQAPETGEIAAPPAERGSGSPAPAARENEIDVSNEWEQMLSVESGTEAAAPIQEMEVLAASEHRSIDDAEPRHARGFETGVDQARATSEAVAKKVKEIESYVSRQLWDAAKEGILALTEIAPDAPEVTALIAAVSAGQSRSSAKPAAAPAPKRIAPEPPPSSPQPTKSARSPFVVERSFATGAPAAAAGKIQAEPLTAKKPAPQPLREKPVAESPAPSKRSEIASNSTLKDILDLSEHQPPLRPAAPAARAAAKEISTEDVLADFVLDLENKELADFAPRGKSDPASAVKAAAAPVPLAAPSAASAPASPLSRSEATQPRKAQPNGDLRELESASVLSDILAELQEDGGEPEETEDDPETHYNLGIAFKEMGLLDEAIGELQKVCRSMDRGNSFAQPIQAYTWLAQCLVDKGAPEAAVRWYKKALQLPTLDDGSRCAIYYDLALAFEASGDKKSALASFMEVYGSNIDFRDVASRIKDLKS